jgi:hypothetical protein
MCFDFTVKFANYSQQDIQTTETNIWNYYDKNKDFFQSQGYKKYDSKLSLGSITLGKLINNESKEQIIDMISRHQLLKNIKVVNF